MRQSSITLKKLFVVVVLGTQIINLLTPTFASAETASASPAPTDVSRCVQTPDACEPASAFNTAPAGTPDKPASILSLANQLGPNAKLLAIYADARKKIKFNPVDEAEITRWLQVSQAIKNLKTSDPQTYAAVEATGFQKIPDSISKQFGLDKKPLAITGKDLLTGIFDLVIPTDAAPGGAGGSYLEISRLLADYNTDKKAISREGEEKDPAIEEKTISSHFRDNVQAADIAAFDQILCTKLTIEQDPKNSQLKVTKREKLAPIPIQFAWQAQAQQQGALGGTGSSDGRVRPNTLGGLLGFNPADLFRRISRDAVVSQILGILSAAGLSLQPADLQFPTDSSVGTTELADVYDRLSQAMLRDTLGASLGGSPLRFGTSLGDTLDRTGSAILGEAFPKMPASAIAGRNLTDWAENLARANLGEQLVDSGFTISGDTGHDIARNLGLQYFMAKVLNLAPTTDLGTLPTNTPAAVLASIGRVAASQKLGIPLADVDSSPTIRGQTDLVDARLDLAAGTTARLASGALSADQYFELVGQAVIDTSLSAYAADPAVRMQAAGLSIVFGPEDVYLPAVGANATRADEVAELAPLYQPRLSAGDWNFFASHYQSARFGDLTDETVIRTWLATHLVESDDLLSPIFAGTATDATWKDIGLRVLAKMDPKPITQLGLLLYLQTGTMPTVAVAGSAVRSPLVDVDTVAGNRLGLLPGDVERIRTDRFTTEVLPRLSSDAFLEAIGQKPAGAGIANGLPAAPNPSDEFLLAGLDTLAKTAQSLTHLPAGGVAARDQFVSALRSTTAQDWAVNSGESRATKIRQTVGRLGGLFLTLKPYLSIDDLRTLSRQFAALVAGRTLPDLNSLTPPTVPVDRSLGLTSDLMTQLFTGQISPDQARRQLGANYLTSYFWDTDDPAAMAADLLAAAGKNTAAATNAFIAKYQGVFDTMAGLVEQSLQLGGNGQLTGSQFGQLFAGNRLPLFGRFGSLLYQSVTGQAGTIFGASGTDFLQAAGLKQLFDAAGWVGNLQTLGGNLANFPRLIFEQSTGLSWATNPTDFVKANGANLLIMLGAPSNLAQQFAQAWNSDNPGKAVEMLAKQAVWDQIPIEQTFKNAFGADIGGSMAGAVRDMFLNGKSPDAALRAISQNPERFIGDIAGQLGVPFDTGPLIAAIKTGDTGALTTQLISLGGQYFDSRLAGLATILTSKDHSPQTLTNYALTTLPSFFGNSSQVAALANLGVALNNYFVGGQKDSGALLAAAGAFGSAIGIPYAADAARIFADPRGFGTAYAASLITQQLNGAFGGGYINYADVRTALFGLGPNDYAALAGQVKAELDAIPAGTFDDATRQAIFDHEMSVRAGKLQAAAQERVMYASLDAVAGLPPGFTQAMLKGTDGQKLDALLAGATKFGNLPPELNVAIDLIKSGGDLSKISATTYGLLDQQLSGLIGVPLPAGFTKGVADVIAGKQTIQQFSQQMGNFGIGQVSGMLDEKLGLPVGTSYTLYQAFNQIGALQTQLQTLNTQAADAYHALAFGGDPSKAAQLGDINKQISGVNNQLAGIEAGLATMAVNLVAGQQIHQFEQSLGVPPGTVSFFLNAGVSSLLGGGSFMAVLSAAAPWFAGGLLLGQLLGGSGFLSGAFGGGNQTVTMCSPGDFYPYVKRGKNPDGSDEEGIFDPNPNLDKFQPDKRLKPDEVAQKLGLWPGYPGEFAGEQTSKESYAWGKQASARWKIREVTGHLLLLPQLTHNEAMEPKQLILYDIPQGQRGTDGDYLRYYDGRETKDPRFIHTNLAGDTLGIIDWPFPLDPAYPGPGYGSGTPDSGNAAKPDSIQQERYGNYNVGLWVENAREYLHHIHYGA